MRKIAQTVVNELYASRGHDKKKVLSRTNGGGVRDMVCNGEYFLFGTRFAWFDDSGFLWIKPHGSCVSKVRLNALAEPKASVFTKKFDLKISYRDRQGDHVVRDFDEPFNLSRRMFQSEIEQEAQEKKEVNLKEHQEAYLAPLYS